MALIALDGTPLVRMGGASVCGIPSIGTLGNVTIDGANEAAIMIGQIFTEDGASHTIDTSGSSSLGWRTGSITFANGGTTAKVGLAAVDLTAGPPARAVASTHVITFDVNASFTGGGGGITGTSWQESVPTSGSKTIANGDLVAFAVQLTARAGADVLTISVYGNTVGQSFPGVTFTQSAAYASSGAAPNAVITFSDGTLGFFFGGSVASVGATSLSFNSGSSPNEYGNLLQAPFPMKVYGITLGANLSGNCDVVLYSEPLGTPAAEKTRSVDLNTLFAPGNSTVNDLLFSSPYTVPANTPVAVILKPTSVTNVTMFYRTCNAASHQKAESFGANGYAVNRASGAFAAQNSNKDRFPIGLLVGGFDNAAGGVTPHVIGG